MGRYDATVEALGEAAHLDRAAHDLDGELEAVTHLMEFTIERGTHLEALPWVETLLPRLEELSPSKALVRFFCS
ncbi:MAG: hypothetical protein ACR2JC_20605 [Chloroflexota bacterium]